MNPKSYIKQTISLLLPVKSLFKDKPKPRNKTPNDAIKVSKNNKIKLLNWTKMQKNLTFNVSVSQQKSLTQKWFQDDCNDDKFSVFDCG